MALLSMPHEGKHVSDIDHAANHLRIEVLSVVWAEMHKTAPTLKNI